MVIYINHTAFDKIKSNQKTLEIRRKNKYTDEITDYITLASNSDNVTMKVKKIVIIDNIMSFINIIDISLVGWNSKEKYLEKLKSYYKNMSVKFVAIYL